MNIIHYILILLIVVYNSFIEVKAYDLKNVFYSSHAEHSEQHHEKEEHIPSLTSDIERQEDHSHLYLKHCHHHSNAHHPQNANPHAHHCHHSNSNNNYYFIKNIPDFSCSFFVQCISFYLKKNFYLSIFLENKLRPPIHAFLS
jgi:hypothetical protein